MLSFVTGFGLFAPVFILPIFTQRILGFKAAQTSYHSFEPGTRTLPAGLQLAPRFRTLTLPVDIIFEQDVAVTLRDGATSYVDVFRPMGTEPLPVIVAWSPYGKSGGSAPKTTNLFGMLGLDNAMPSGLAKFERPDTVYWCAQGYAIATSMPVALPMPRATLP
jgi:predicted acyl esterase